MAEPAACGCACGTEARTMILYSCSGAANTGEMADRVARILWAEGKAKRSCLAAIGADLSGYLESAKSADNLVIDGCPVACGKRAFENRGLSFRHMVLTDHGPEKGKTPVEEGVIDALTGKAREIFGL